MSRMSPATLYARLMVEQTGMPHSEALQRVRAGEFPRFRKDMLARWGGWLVLVHGEHTRSCVLALHAVMLERRVEGMPEFVDEFPCVCGVVWRAAPLMRRSDR